MPEGFLTELAKSGPWALVAGLLLLVVIRAWTKDRDQLTGLLGEFKDVLREIRVAVTANTSAVNELKEEFRRSHDGKRI